MASSVRTTSVERVVFRYSNYDSPFWARNNRTDGRWHVIGDGATQYMTLEPDAAWAELARHENLRTESDLQMIRMPIWAAELAQMNLVDYSTFALAEAQGFPPDALVDDDWSRCQAEGSRLRALGYTGVVAPSAALPGATNATLFGRRVLMSWGRPPSLASCIPACVVAVGGPAAGLPPRVRYRSEIHLGLDAYSTSTGTAGTRPPEGSGGDAGN